MKELGCFPRRYLVTKRRISVGRFSKGILGRGVVCFVTCMMLGGSDQLLFILESMLRPLVAAYKLQSFTSEDSYGALTDGPRANRWLEVST